MPKFTKIDHIAIATDDLEKSLSFYQNCLGLECSKIEENVERGLKIAFLPIGDTNIELLCPLNSSSEISAFLAKKGPGLHHIAFESTGITKDMAEIKQKNFQFTTEHATLGAHHSQVAFIHPKASNKVLIELVEKKRLSSAPDNRAKSKRVLGVDLGLKRTGLAVSDELGLTTRALENLIPRSRAQDIEALLEICTAMNIGTVVFGIPLRTGSEKEGGLAKRFRAFADSFLDELGKAELHIEVALMDEALTSKQAAVRLAESAVAEKKRRTLIDGEAARILVEEFLATHGNSKL